MTVGGGGGGAVCTCGDEHGRVLLAAVALACGLPHIVNWADGQNILKFFCDVGAAEVRCPGVPLHRQPCVVAASGGLIPDAISHTIHRISCLGLTQCSSLTFLMALEK